METVPPQVGLAVLVVVGATTFTLLSMVRRRRIPGRRLLAAGERAQQLAVHRWQLDAALVVATKLLELEGPIDLRPAAFDLALPAGGARTAAPSAPPTPHPLVR